MRTQPLYLSVALLAALVNCGGGERKQTVTPLLVLHCGPLSLRFEEHSLYVPFPAGAWGFSSVLSMNDGGGWKIIAGGSPPSPRAYAALLPPTAGFHWVEASTERRGRSDWNLYVDPAVVNDVQYAAICSCIDAHVKEIDDAFWTPRDPQMTQFSLQPERRPNIRSLIHVKWDDRFTAPDRTALGHLWNCSSDVFLKTVPPGDVSLCSIAQTERVCYPIGYFSNAALQLHEPAAPIHRKITGPDWRAFYAGCRDANGKSLQETVTTN